MSRLYIEGDEARFIHKDIYLIDVEFFSGEKLEDLEPRRLFPLSGLTKYITLLDEKGVEKAIVRNIDTLIPESKAILEDCLKEYYMIPKINEIIDCNNKFGILKWITDTDRGVCEFTINNIHSDIKVLYGNRIIIRDSNDNRYEIPNADLLNKKSKGILNSFI
ncbi:MAG: DUF1854 domain-containing protein [Saccharofermentanales bacterium]